MAGRGLTVPQVPVGGNAFGRSPVPDVPTLDNYSKGLNSLADEAKQMAEEIHRTEVRHDQVKVVKAETGILASTDAEVAKLDPLSKDYLKQVEDVYSRAKESATTGANLSTREAREELDARLSRIGAVGQVHALAKQRNSVQEEALRTFDTASNEVLAKVRRDPQAASTYVGGFQADASKLTEGLTPDVRRKVEDKLKDSVLSAQALGYADRGNYAMAKKLLDDNMGTLNPAQEQKVRYEMRAIEEKARTDSARAAANLHADVAAKIEDWKYSPDQTSPPPYSRADIEKMRPQFANNPAGYLSLVTLLDGAMYSREKAQVSTREALQNAETRSLRNQQEADLAFNNMYSLHGKKPSEVFTPELLSAAGNFAREQGYVPSVYKTQIENAGRAGGLGGDTPQEQQRLASAVAAYDRINELAPNTKWGFADDKGSRVQLASSMAKQEQISVQEASRRVLALSPKTETETADRLKAYTDAFKQAHGTGQGQNATNWLRDQVKSQFGSIGQSVAGLLPSAYGPGAGLYGPPSVAPDVAADYERQLKANYLKVPDWDTAKKATDAWLKQTYDVTHVGDRNEITKYAPEKYIDPKVADRVSVYGMTTRIIQDDVTKILEKNKIIPGRNPYDTKLPGWRLYADDQTAKEADQWQAAGATGPRGPVTYRIQVLDSFGVYQNVDGPRYRAPNAEEISSHPDYIANERKSISETKQAREAEAARSRLRRDPRSNP